MKKNVQSIIAAFIATIFSVNAQVGIGTETPRATLEVAEVNSPDFADGILIPRITRERAETMVGVENSLLVYIEDATGYTSGDSGVASMVNEKGFYYYNADESKWMKLPDFNQTLSATYWKAQASTNPKNEKDTKNTPTELVEYDIYQKGKVGIGYDSDLDIDFERNPTQKQLEVGGDFRTSYHAENSTNPANNGYYGFETNSEALPDIFTLKGNILYNTKTKNLDDYSFIDRVFDGSMFIQSGDGLNLLSRTGLSTNAAGSFGNEVVYGATGGYQFVYNYFANASNNKIRFSSFDLDKYYVEDYMDNKVQFGLDFNQKKFYLGDVASSAQYYFPNARGNANQILRLNSTRDSLEWSDISSIVSQPWRVQNTNLFSTNHTDNIYQQGKVAVGFTDQDVVSTKQFEVKGDVKISSNSSNIFTNLETNSDLVGGGTLLLLADNQDINQALNQTNLYALPNFLGFNISSNQTSTLSGMSMASSGVMIAADNQSNPDHFTRGNISISDKTVLLQAGTSQTTNQTLRRNANISIDQTQGITFNFDNGESLIQSYTFPKTRGTNNQVLTSVGSANVGELEWRNVQDLVATSTPKFFYMPSVILPITPTDALITPTGNYTYASGVYTVNLYALFNNQFTTPIASSSTTSNLTEFVKIATAYDYFVTRADSAIFNTVTINANGVLTYRVNADVIANSGSFMNIVLKVK